MKVHLQPCLILFFFICSSSVVVGQSLFPSYQSDEELRKDVTAIISDFDLFMKANGITPPFKPRVNIQTAPFLIKWDGPNHSIILPLWNELLDEQKQLFQTWKGEYAEAFFTSLFNWFFVPHELGHFVEINFNSKPLTPYEQEMAANKFAIAFFRSQKINHEKLEYIKINLEEVLHTLPNIDFGELSEEEYFNQNYQQLGRDPNAYGYFQFTFILQILNNPEQIDLQEYYN